LATQCKCTCHFIYVILLGLLPRLTVNQNDFQIVFLFITSLLECKFLKSRNLLPILLYGQLLKQRRLLPNIY
jgi:hypothetical protein